MEPSASAARSQINIPVFISWLEAQNIARQYLVGMELDQGSLSVVIQALELREQAGNVFIKLVTKGTYDGDIILTAMPVYDKQKNKIVFEAFDLQMDTGNFFQKGMVLLMRGTIEKELKKAFDIPINQLLKDLLKMVNAQLEDFRPSPQVKITGTIDQIDLLELSYAAKGINMQVAADGYLQFFIDSPESLEFKQPV